MLIQITFPLQIYYDRILKLLRVDYVTDSLPPYNTETTATEIHDFNTGKYLYYRFQKVCTELFYFLCLARKSTIKSVQIEIQHQKSYTEHHVDSKLSFRTSKRSEYQR